MKKTVQYVSVALASSLFLVGCGGGKGGGGGATAVNTGAGRYSVYSNEFCDIQTNYYTCTQTIGGISYSTLGASFVNQQDFCSKISDNYSSINKDRSQTQLVASNTRARLASERCQQVGGLPTVPGGTNLPTVPSTDQYGLKSFTCQLQVRKGQAYYAGSAQQFSVARTGGRIVLISPTMQNRQVWKFFNVAYMKSLANVVLDYKPALVGDTKAVDMVKMSVSNIDGEISASVSGYAGSEVRIELMPQDADATDGTQLVVSCTGAAGQQTIANNSALGGPPLINQAAVTSASATDLASALKENFACKGTEVVNGKTKEINYVNKISDVVESGISVSNSVFIQAEGSAQQGAVTFSQSSSGVLSATDVNLKASLTAQSAITIEKANYSLKLKCQAK